MGNTNCVCGEINSRNCPVHQNQNEDEGKRYYLAHSLERVWMEEVHKDRETEDGHYYSATDYTRLQASRDAWKRLAEACKFITEFHEAGEHDAMAIEAKSAEATLREMGEL